MPGPTLAGKVTLDDSQAAAALRRLETVGAAAAAKLQGSVGGALKSFTGPIAAIGPALAAAFAGKAIVSGVANVFEAGRALQVLSRQTGASVGGLAVLQSKFRAAGVDSELVARSIFRLQKSIAGVEDEENKGGAGRLQQLGLDLAALQKADPAAQLFAVGNAISKISDPAERTAAAMQIFGKSGAELGAVFNGSGFGQISSGMAAKAQMLARNAAIFEQVSLKLERVGNITKTFYAGVADKVSTTLLPMLDKLEKINLVAVGQKFGSGLAAGAQALAGVFANPKALTGAFFASIMADEATFGNQLIAVGRYAAQSFVAAFKASPEIFKNVAEGLGYALLAGAEKFGAVTISLMGKAAIVLQAGINWVSENGVAKLGTKLVQVALDFAKSLADAISSPGAAVVTLGAKIAHALKDEVSETLADALSNAVEDKGLDLGGALDKRAGVNAAKAGASFAAAGQATATALTSPTYEVKDALGAAGYGEEAKKKLAELRKSGAKWLGMGMPPGEGENKPGSGLSKVQQTRLLAQSHMALASSGAPVDANPLTYMFMAPKVAPSLAWMRTNATDPYTSRVDAARRADMSASHTIGINGALDFDPSRREGWTGAKNMGWGHGGLGGGAYGATGNIWNQVSGRVGGGPKTNEQHVATIAGHVQTMKDDMSAMRRCWEGGGSSSGGGGATTTGK